ncbi:MAG TPA: cyclic nucleotide-binding domain-containing protein [Candidatus Limnocylindrales bacterium]|nr:cyclic nucleotide-binding domain-containing protein [Candidatus Limnocylindrales bacterium]
MNEQYAAIMATFPILQGFTAAGAQMLLEGGTIKNCVPGEILFKEGDPPISTLLVLKGKLEVFVQRQGLELILREPGPGAILGELAVLCEIPRSASLRAVSDAVVLVWTAVQFRTLLLRHKLFSERVLGQSLRNLIEKEHSIVDSLMAERAGR